MAEKNNRFVCSICLDDFRKPKIIDCHHTYCEHCLEDYVQKFAKNNRFLCPLCREEINIPVGGVKKFASNFYIEEKSVGNNKIQQCDVCINVPSEFRCAECEQHLCNLCKTNHVLNAHKPNENVNVRRKSFCKKHTSEILDFYCRECSEIICIKCLMSRHKDHTTPDLDDFGEEVSMGLAEQKQALVEIVNKFKDAVTAIDSQTSRQRQQFDLSCDEVDERIAEIFRTSRETGEQLKADMKKLIEEDEGETKKIKEDYENLISTLGASLSHADESLKDPTVGELLTISDSLTSQRKANVDKKAIIPNLRRFKFNKGNINIDQDSHQFGFVIQGTQKSSRAFHVRFNKMDIKSNEVCLSPHFEILERTWALAGCSSSTSSLSLRVILLTDNPRKFSFEIKLVNIQDPNLSIANSDVGFISLTTSYKWSNIISLEELFDPSRGFIDDNGNFNIEIIIRGIGFWALFKEIFSS